MVVGEMIGNNGPALSFTAVAAGLAWRKAEGGARRPEKQGRPEAAFFFFPVPASYSIHPTTADYLC